MHNYTRSTPTGLTNWQKITRSPILVLTEAEKFGIAWRAIPSTNIIELTYNGKKNYFMAQDPIQTSCIAHFATRNKSIGKGLLLDAGLAVTKGYAILPSDPESYYETVFNSLQKPLVVKPTNMSQGRSVYLGITDLTSFTAAVKACMETAFEEFAGVMVEETFTGNEYRILVTREKIIGVIYRIPANVTGDGHSTIQELIAIKNSDPRRVDDPSEALCAIRIDDHVLTHLKENGRSVTDVPKLDEVVYLRKNSNISTGGDSIDFTDQVHESVNKIALQAIQAFPGLEFAGIDFMSKDIQAEQNQDTYRIIEVNQSPGFSIHDLPYKGESRHAAREFLYLLFPELSSVVLQ